MSLASLIARALGRDEEPEDVDYDNCAHNNGPGHAGIGGAAATRGSASHAAAGGLSHHPISAPLKPAAESMPRLRDPQDAGDDAAPWEWLEGKRCPQCGAVMAAEPVMEDLDPDQGKRQVAVWYSCKCGAGLYCPNLGDEEQ